MPDLDPTDLRSAAQQLLERPLAEPTPLPELQARARLIVQRRRRLGTALTVVALLLLVLGVTTVVTQAGGSTKRISSATGGGPTTTTVAAAATTTSAAAATASPGATSASAAASAATAATARATTATTVKKSSATTSKASSAVLAAPANKAVSAPVSGGIANVTAPAAPAARADVQTGGSVTMLQAADLTSFDPAALAGSAASDGVAPAAVFDVLLYNDPATGSIVPETAESLTSPDGTTWTLKLRGSMKFTDGSPYDAAAVKFNWERLQSPDNHALRAAQASQIQSMTVVDPLTLRITLRSRNVLFPSSVALIPYIGSPTAMSAKGTGFGTDPVGAGPFVLKNWQRDSQMTLTRSATYWNAPRPYLDQLVLKPVADESQRINAYANGQADMVAIVSPQGASQIGKAPNTSGYPVVLNGGTALWFNTKKAPFNDARARRAIAMAIDPKDYVASVDGGSGSPIDSVFRPESPFYDASIVQPAYDPAGAQKLFDQLAAERGGALTFTMTLPSAQPYQAAAQYIQSTINRFTNVKMSVQAEPASQHTASCTSGGFDSVCLIGQVFTDPEPAWTSLYTCGATPSPTGWCNAQFDRDIADSQQTVDAKQRVADMKDAQKQLYGDVPAMYVDRAGAWVFATTSVRDVGFAGDGVPLVDRLWLQGRGSTTTTTSSTVPPTTTTTRVVTTVPTTTPTTRPPTTTTTVKPVTTTAAKPGTTTSSSPSTTTSTTAAAAPIPTIETIATTTTTNPEVALAPAAASQSKRVSPGMLALLVLLAVVFGVTSCAAFFLWRQQRAGAWWE